MQSGRDITARVSLIESRSSASLLWSSTVYIIETLYGLLGVLGVCFWGRAFWDATVMALLTKDVLRFGTILEDF